jgi:hypothetical protein
VSSIVGTIDKSALMIWIEQQATLGAVQAERLGELVGDRPMSETHSWVTC